MPKIRVITAVIAACAGRILTGKKGVTGRHADRGGGKTMAEHHRIRSQRVQVWRLDMSVPQSGDGIIALLVSKKD